MSVQLHDLRIRKQLNQDMQVVRTMTHVLSYTTETHQTGCVSRPYPASALKPSVASTA